MSKLAETIKAHYAGVQLGQVVVPEWDLTIYVRPATIGQSAAIMKEEDQWHQACRLIQVRAKDSEGKPLFDQTDFEAMVKYGDAALINRIVSEMIDIGEPKRDDAKKS